MQSRHAGRCQQDRQPHSTGTHPGPGYRRVPVPTLPLSGSALSSGARGQAGPCPCRGSARAPLAEAQSSSSPPGSSNLLCLYRYGTRGHTHGLTHTHLTTHHLRRGGKVPGGGASSVHTAWGCPARAEQDTRAPGLPRRHCTQAKAPKAATSPDYRGSQRPGAHNSGEKALPCLQGGLRELHFPPGLQRPGLSPSLQGGPFLWPAKTAQF